jgi:outer membrane protein OmpA-like peptidoglycan-associated protein
MGSKIVALTAIIVSGAFFYYCIDTKKEKILSSCGVLQSSEEKSIEQKEQQEVLPVVQNENINETTPSTEKEEIVSETVETKETEKSDPAFGVMLGEKVNIVGMFSPEAKEKALIRFIDKYCADRECINDIRFSDDIKTVGWQRDMVSLIQMFEEEHIEKGSLYINSNVLHIEGEIATVAQKKRLESLITKLKESGLFVEDETIDMITKVPVTTNVSAHNKEANETVDEEDNIQNTPKEQSSESIKQKTDSTLQEHDISEMKVETSENKISDQETSSENVTNVVESSSLNTEGLLSEKVSVLLSKNPIAFDVHAKNLTEKSKETLSKIAAWVKEKPGVSVEIIGYENSGDPILDMVISQKKADIVANYLYAKGLRKLKSKGLGAKNSKMQIEIKIQKQ